jgi:hypothetical protein
MSKIGEMKAEIDNARLKYAICNLNGFPIQAEQYKGKIYELLEQYVVLLEAEVESLKVEVWGLQDEIRSGPYA